jgi:ADP-ribose pyrophosphatase YjhB (NUDIX family)
MEQKNYKKEGTVCFLRKDDTFLLTLIEYSESMKKWNGIGGFANEGEPLKDAAIREVEEEVGVVIDRESLEYVGRVLENNNFTLYVFIADKWSGEIKIKDDTLKQLQWFSPRNIPYKDMWPDNEYWLPDILSGKKIIASVMRDVYTDIKPLTERDVQIEEVAELA